MSSYQYSFAASPDIIRSHQKDAYFTAHLSDHLSALLRSLLGARAAHTYTSELHVLGELLYLGLTTLIGNRTLGEEYCDIVQVEDATLALPAVQRRAGYILSSVLVPYGLGRILPVFRRKVRAKLEATLRKSAAGPGQRGDAHAKPNPGLRKLQQYVLENLDTITSPSPVYALSLAVFYFSGAYYQLGKRMWGLRYIFTRRVEEGEQRVGYEVLGVLLVLQLTVQAWLHLRKTLDSSAASMSHIASTSVGAGVPAGRAVIDGGVEVSLDPNMYSSNNALLFESSGVPTPETSVEGLEKITHTPVLGKARQMSLVQHILPLRGGQ
ncbi:MAG: hypothetical protein Q9165_001751 [Trypethelium subeluteriae]